MAASARNQESTQLAGSAALTPGSEAAAAAFGTLRFGEAPRVGVLGDPGCGKTHAMRELVALYQRESPGAVLIIDDKEPMPQFPGVTRKNRDDLAARPIAPGERVIVFRGQQFVADGGVDAESIADLQLQLAQRKRASLVVYDELHRAAHGGQWRAGKLSKISWAFSTGRSLGAASLWGTQQTQSVPYEAFDCSSAILCFRMMGNPVRLLKARGYCEGGADVVIPTLAGEPLPPAQRGTFVLLQRGKPWDRRVYKFGV